MSFLDAMKEAAVEVAASIAILVAFFATVVMLYYVIVLIYRIITGKYNDPKTKVKDNRKYTDYQNILNDFFINSINEDIAKMSEIHTPASDKLISLYREAK
jgi:hypothetical protein